MQHTAIGEVALTAFANLSDAMLKWHGLKGNKVMTPNVIGSINIVTKENSVDFGSAREAPKAHVERLINELVRVREK